MSATTRVAAGQMKTSARSRSVRLHTTSTRARSRTSPRSRIRRASRVARRAISRARITPLAWMRCRSAWIRVRTQTRLQMASRTESVRRHVAFGDGRHLRHLPRQWSCEGPHGAERWRVRRSSAPKALVAVVDDGSLCGLPRRRPLGGYGRGTRRVMTIGRASCGTPGPPPVVRGWFQRPGICPAFSYVRAVANCGYPKYQDGRSGR